MSDREAAGPTALPTMLPAVTERDGPTPRARRAWPPVGILTAVCVGILSVLLVLRAAPWDTTWTSIWVSRALLVLPALAALVAAIVSGTSPLRKTLGALSALAAALLMAGVTDTESSFGWMPWFALLFVSWALTYPIRPVGWFALILLGAGSAAITVLTGAWLAVLFGHDVPGDVALIGFTGVLVVPLAALFFVTVVLALQWGSLPPVRADTTPAPPWNVAAVISLVAAPFIGIVGVIFGHLAVAQLRRSPGRGRGLAIAGLTIGYLTTYLSGALLILWGMTIVSGPGPGWTW
ncbi:DUF4190 domain-containing protein [Microbacterium sp.]|uniref:DUF4190 domain-containing protein n=1 Tax=Microbacterium sp. TaxID=51671 RepID=UPI003A8B54B4